MIRNTELPGARLVTARLLAALLLAAACGGDATRWQGTVETLPSGGVRVINPAQGIWQEATAWRLVPELRLGVEEGDDAQLFGQISGLEAGADGRIYVLDRQANELRIFAADGSHVRTVGRSGGGPGEYANANGLLWIAPDSLLVIDQRGNRYTVLTGDGDFARSVPRNLGFFGWVFSGAQHDGVIYESGHVFEGTDPARWEETARPVMFATDVRGEATAHAVAAENDAPDAQPAATRTDTLFLPRMAGPVAEAFSVRTERGGMSMSVPFAPPAVYHLDRDGTIWFGRGSSFRLTRATLAGDTLLEIVLEAVAAPVTDEELAEWEAGASVTRFREMGGRLDMSRIPRSKPHFDRVYDDPDGNLWVAVPAAPLQTVFAIFDPDGRYLGRLWIDGVSRVPYLPPVVRNDRLYLVGTDELDVQRVHVFRIER